MIDAPKKLPPAGLHPEVADRLLDRLSDPEDKLFRELFEISPQAAIELCGYSSPAECMVTRDGVALPTAEEFAKARDRYKTAMTNSAMFWRIHDLD